MNSLVTRTVTYLCGAQVLAFFVAWLVTIAMGLMGLDQFATSADELGAIRARKQVIASLKRAADGGVELQPTDELAEELRRAPGMKVAAFTGTGKRPIPGSSPQLVEVLQRIIFISPEHTHFVMPGDPPTVRTGLMEPRNTPFGRIYIAVQGQKFRWPDLLDAAADELQWLASYFIMVILMSAAAAWLAVRWSLYPVKLLAEQARRIDMNSLEQRLDAAVVSTEVEPLVAAFNDALDRLDAGVARQRRFTANAAHELRTPVSILGARLDAPEEPTFRNDLKRDHRRIRNIVEQLLAASRLGVSRNAADEMLDLCAIAQGIISDAALLALRAKRQVALDAPDQPVLAMANRSAVESVMANLVDNAIRAEPEGGTVIMRIAANAQVDVIDHGVGVAVDDREAVFEPFWRKEPQTPGSGLGLAIARELMTSLGGEIWVDDTPGGGATFKLAFRR